MDRKPQTQLTPQPQEGGQGLTVRRYFTTPAEHPFDGVEWELRDARIGHGDKLAFEQRDVEFPKSWSQNATNIVAQKYFRGQLGSPARERSVKQMIGRVAGTIANWGREYGYFATDEDGDAFEAELTYILLHQIAAFNSPVWFNVGFEERPQCSACLPYHALVSTPDGMVPIGQIVEDDQVGREVYDSNGTTTVVAVKANGRKPVWRIRLRNGGFIEATPDHVVKATRSRRTRPEWVRVDQLAVGMRLHLHPHRAKVDSRALVPAGASGVHDDAFELDEVENTRVSEAALAGWLQADGFVGQYDHGTNRSLTIEFQVANEDEYEWITSHLDVVFPEVHRKVRDADTEVIPVRRIRLYGEVLRDFVERWELLARGTDMRVPSVLWTASHEEICAYLQSVFQADGYVSTRQTAGCENSRVAVAVIGERWTEDLQLLLMTLGIYSRRIRKRDARPDRHDLYELTIGIGSERARFAELIGFPGRQKSDKLLQSLTLRDWKTCPDLREEQIVSIEPQGVQDVYDIQTASGEFLTNNVAVHNCFILSVEDTMESILEWNTKEGMIFRGGSGSGINLSKIRGSMEPLGKGGTASGPVSFMRGADAWAGTIKSGGKTRRAAKMVVLDVDHPDVEEFIWCKAKEEDKAAALRDAGFDMSIDGDGFYSIQYQNANNSVRVSDEFMRAVENDEDWELTARTTGKPTKKVRARELMQQIAEAAWRCADPGVQYDTTINQWHTCPNSGRINASNPCSEYMHVDDSACNLASLNLMKFRQPDGSFDVDSFKHAVDVMLLAQEIVVSPSSYPTEEIGRNARAFRQLGLGYANLGAYLMANGIPYDSDQGRATAAAITALMTGRGYLESARVAAAIGPYERYEENRDAHNAVMRMHRDAAYAITDSQCSDHALLEAARTVWDDAVEAGEAHGYRNAQATVLAPTGCLVAGSLVTTSRGLVRLGTLGDPDGSKWQDLDIEVATDDGPRQATKFYVNGMEQVVSVETHRGYRIQGTPTHRIKVIDGEGNWAWRRMAEVQAGDRVPMMLGQMVGEPQEVVLPPLGDLHWNADHRTRVPRVLSPELAEFIGYFMGDGSLHAKGIRLCVSDGDDDVVERLLELGEELFGLVGYTVPRAGYTEVGFHSVPLTIWWEACGFSKLPPYEGHSGKGYSPRIPDAVLHSNDRHVYAAFIRGLFEADGNANHGYVYWMTSCEEFSRDVQTLLLALGYVTTRDVQDSWNRLGGPGYRLRLLNAQSATRYVNDISFISERKNEALSIDDHPQAARYDLIPVSRGLLDDLAPENDGLRKSMLLSLSRTGAVSRRSATALLERAPSPELEHLLGYFYDTVESAELIADQPTFDLSVPDNVTYVANGFVSHNTISFLMDCDTTGVEPDFSLVKFKELVGGGQMTIVNRTVPQALETLGYTDEQTEQIIAYINEHGTIVGAPDLNDEDLPVFDVAVGERAISHMGHIKMMGAVQPFISGAISKCVTGDTLVASEHGLVRIGSLYRGESPDSFRELQLHVASLDGTRSTDAFYYGGERPVSEVTLRSGHRIVGTDQHRVLVCGDDGLLWRRLCELHPGEFVATQYGADLWSESPARFDDFVMKPRYGSQKDVRLPAQMNEHLAFVLGAFAAEGHIARSNWTIRISNADEAVLPLIADASRRAFGIEPTIVRPAGKCPSVVLSSKTLVEFFDYLGTGDRASNKRIPDAVLRSPRSMVLRFLEGLCLDAYISTSGMAKWAICLDSKGLLDDLQAILTNLGVVHGRVTKHNAAYDKSFDEVYAAGREAQKLAVLLNFVEPHKALRALELRSRSFAQSTADVIPGITGAQLYELVPKGSGGRYGKGTSRSRHFRHLVDPRTKNVSRVSVERVALLEEVELPDWLDFVVEQNLHFSPVVSVVDGGVREVFDISVPETHAFVANGIVNHNTVNLPESASVEDIADAYLQAWHLGVKALAIYRDGSKTAQALRTDAQKSKPATTTQADIDKAVAEALAEAPPKRRRMPRERQSITHKFSIGGHEGYITAGMYEDGSVGEIFLTDIGKEGSTLRGMMNSFATAISISLQYGVPLETLVRKFSYMRFEPEGMTSNPEIPFAKSMPDYIMRWLASRFLDADLQEELGILTPEVRARKAAQDAASSRVSDTAGPANGDNGEEPKGDGNGKGSASASASATPAPAAAALTDEPPVHPAVRAGLDLGPACQQCGGMMQRTGSCYTCSSCGYNTGCG